MQGDINMTYIDFKNFDAVLFDLDGTLADSMHIWRDIDLEFLDKFDIRMPENLQSEIEGLSFYQTAVYFKENFNLSWSLEEIMDCWNQMAYENYSCVIKLKPGVIELLRLLKEHNIKTGIATSNSRNLTEAFLKAANAIDYFDVIVTSGEVTIGKPAPDIYLHAASVLNVANNKCIVFEDLPAGLLAGNRAGMTTCAVEDSYSKLLRKEKLKLSDMYLEDYLSLECIFD